MRSGLLYLNLLLAASQFAASGFSRLTGIGRPVEDIAMRGGAMPPETPMGYAFSIWLVIFAFAVAYAYKQLKEKREADPAVTGIFMCSIAWMMTAQIFGDGWHLVAIILAMWVFAVTAFKKELASPAPDKKTALPMLGLYSGWLSVAVVLNITSTTAGIYGTFDLTPTAYALFTLLPASMIAVWLIRASRGNLWYAGAVLWALHAVIVANVLRIPNTTIALVAAGLMILVSAVTYISARRKS